MIRNLQRLMALSIALMMGCVVTHVQMLADRGKLNEARNEVLQSIPQTRKFNAPLRVNVIGPDDYAGQRSGLLNSYTYSYPVKDLIRDILNPAIYTVFNEPRLEVQHAFNLEVEIFESQLRLEDTGAPYQLFLKYRLYLPGEKLLTSREVVKQRVGTIPGANEVPGVVYETIRDAVREIVEQIQSDPKLLPAVTEAGVEYADYTVKRDAYMMGEELVRPGAGGAGAGASKARTSQESSSRGNQPSPLPAAEGSDGPAKSGNGTPPETYALIVGISEYQDAQINPLALPAKDARSFAGFLKDQGIKDANKKVLINTEATQANIRAALQEYLGKADSNDMIIFYWAGHGFANPQQQNRAFMPCYDTPLDEPGKGVDMTSLRDMLERNPARHKLVLADVCHGQTIVMFAQQRGLKLLPADTAVKDMSSQNAIPAGMAMLVASQMEMPAIEVSQLSNGVFTHVLLEGLRGKADGYEGSGEKDGYVTLGELRKYLSKEMPMLTKRYTKEEYDPITAVNTTDRNINMLCLSVLGK